MTIQLYQFGHTGLNGLQHKGIVSVNGQDQFVKLDRLNPTVNGKWEDKFDMQYSSVSESIVSCLARHIDSRYRYADYRFATFEENGKPLTGTCSDILFQPGEVEQVLSIGQKRHPEAQAYLSIDEYAENIVDAKQEHRLNQLVHYMVENHVPEEDAKAFLLEQAVFDTITGNQDRLHNPSNFVIAYNTVTKQSTPVNLDYGRTIQNSLIGQRWEEVYDLNDPYFEDDVKEYAELALSKNDAILSGHNLKSHIEVLQSFGAKPLRVNMMRVQEDLDALKEQFKGQPFEKYAIMKCETFQSILQDENIQSLIEDTSLELTFDDLRIEGGEEVMTIEVQGQRVQFLISNQPIMDMTLTDKTVEDVHVYDEYAASIVLPEEKRNYDGLQRQLQYYLNEEKSLPEMLAEIQYGGFSTPIHYHLDVKVDQMSR